MAEEIPDFRRNIPKSLLGTVVVGISTALPLCIVILFCLTDITALMNTPTMTPSLQLFVQAFNGSTAGAIALQSLMVVAVVGSIFGIHTWQSRIAWSFARDNGFPFSRYIGAIAPAPFETLIWAHAWCCLWVALLGCLYLGSIVAFNSFVSGGLLFQYLTYSLCVLSLLAHGRENIEHGPFWLPRIGLVANLVVLAWTVIATVFYSFPSFYPVQPNTMNYVSCVLVGGVLLAGFNWVVHGRKYYMTGDSELDE